MQYLNLVFAGVEFLIASFSMFILSSFYMSLSVFDLILSLCRLL